jgi:hypothetical protein
MGAGTVGFWGARALLAAEPDPADGPAPELAAPAHVRVCDWARVRPKNAVTCPSYAGQEERYKSDVLADEVRGWFKGTVQSFPTALQEFDWSGARRRVAHGKEIVLAGLDAWDARLSLCQDIRNALATGACVADMIVFQCGLDKHRAEVSVYGNRFVAGRFVDPCPICHRASYVEYTFLSMLPTEEAPCVLLCGGEPVRGSLQDEARALGAHVRGLVADLVAGSVDWLNTRHVLKRRDWGEEFELECRSLTRAPDCPGPHGFEAL